MLYSYIYWRGSHLENKDNPPTSDPLFDASISLRECRVPYLGNGIYGKKFSFNSASSSMNLTLISLNTIDHSAVTPISRMFRAKQVEEDNDGTPLLTPIKGSMENHIRCRTRTQTNWHTCMHVLRQLSMAKILPLRLGESGSLNRYNSLVHSALSC